MKNKYHEGQIIKVGKKSSVAVQVRFVPLVNGIRFDNYIYGSLQEAKEASRIQIEKYKGKKVCRCGRVICERNMA